MAKYNNIDRARKCNLGLFLTQLIGFRNVLTLVHLNIGVYMLACGGWIEENRFESVADTTTTKPRHEDRNTFKERFSKDVDHLT